MQGVRRAEVALGETACVIGLGLIGQLVVRLLVASGVQVVGLDTVEARCRAAEKAGALACAGPDDAGVAQLEAVLLERTGGLGADHVLLAAGGDSNGPVEIAARLARDRARIVDIGKTKLDLPWNAYYEKELDVRFSRSYGPGRYDDRYELEGVDYPAGYVRWTERRNLGVLPRPARRAARSTSPRSSRASTPSARPSRSTTSWRRASCRASGSCCPTGPTTTRRTPRPPARTITTTPAPAQPRRRQPATGALRVGFVGAGNYAASMLLPHLREDARVELVSVATTTSLSGINAQRKFGFRTISTDVDAVLDDESLDAVFVVTRHDSHAGLVCRALEARQGRLRREAAGAERGADSTGILAVVEATGNDRLMVGFNRRFAPLVTELGAGWASVGRDGGPVAARYLVNAGRLAAGSWYLNEELEGSRFIGEGGHFIDTLSALRRRRPGRGARRRHRRRTCTLTLRYGDGSVGAISYVTSGSPRFPKETLDVTGRRPQRAYSTTSAG